MIDFDAQISDTKYLVVRRAGILYIIPCPYDISIAHNQNPATMRGNAVLVVDSEGDVTKNRYGPETAVW